MSNLHVYFTLRNEQAFSKALEASRTSQAQSVTLGSSTGKRNTSMTAAIDVNTKDWLGRTVLHLVCGVVEPYALAYMKMLLGHPGINVNLQDVESKWTPLHRALYSGNIAACQLLLRRPDIDVQLRDNEGLTPFDLYNLTVEGTWPLKRTADSYELLNDEDTIGDIFTWGGNRNAALGHGDSKDRAYPDQVHLEKTVKAGDPNKFVPIRVRAVSMAKLHTTILTDENGPNLRVCGFGSGGRLGPSHHTQYTPLPISQLPANIIHVAPAQDHTLALTSRGEIFSWGLNRFSQLGYVVDAPIGAEPVQALPKKIIGPLKKEVVRGVVGCKTASACWTAEEVWTWGTNAGQLGYDSVAHPVQVLPRKVTGVQSVIQVALTDSAMVCLLQTHDIICLNSNARFRVKFPMPDFHDLPRYHPPAASKPPIIKITSCQETFAALSGRGDVWTFSVSMGRDAIDVEKERQVVKPTRVWSARRSIDPATDVALGSDGDLIVCTNSGHVFIRSRSSNSSSSSSNTSTLTPSTTSANTKGKFFRAPFVHRAVRVCANAAGAFGALRVGYRVKEVKVEGNILGVDLRDVRPWISGSSMSEATSVVQAVRSDDDEDIDAEPNMPPAGTYSARGYIDLLSRDKASRKSIGSGLFSAGSLELKHGADIVIQSGMEIPAHRLILAARSPVLRRLLDSGSGSIKEGGVVLTLSSAKQRSSLSFKGKRPRLTITGIQPLSVLLFLHFLYTDAFPVLDTLSFTTASAIRRDVGLVAAAFGLGDSLNIGASGISVSKPSLSIDMWALFFANTPHTAPSLRPDVFLALSDRLIACHSLILRARCLFFRNFFDEEAWTTSRWTDDGTITVDMTHMEWRVMEFVIEWIYMGREADLFTRLDTIESVQALIDLIFDVMAIASELLLDRLMLLCSAALLRYVAIHNVIPLLARATYLNALPLVSTLQDYIACNLEAILESRLLDRDRDREYDVDSLIPALGAFIRTSQAEGAPVTRAGLLVMEAMKKYGDWVEMQDIPSAVVKTHITPKPRRVSMAAPAVGSPPSPLITNVTGGGDDIFMMDLESTNRNTEFPQRAASGTYVAPKTPWKAKPTTEHPKTDMKTIMAETANQSTSNPGPSTPRPVRPIFTPGTTPPGTSPASSWRMPATSSAAVGRRPAATPPRLASSPHTPDIAPSPDPVITPQLIRQKSQSQIQPVAAGPSNIPLGPIFKPSLGSRRSHTNDGPAWNKAPIVPPDPVPTTGLSFAAIQQQQREQSTQPAKEKRSLREIQEEERAQQEEEDFLRWWAAEEQRLKLEAEAAVKRVPPSEVGKQRGGSKGGRRGKSKRDGSRWEEQGGEEGVENRQANRSGANKGRI